nr:hypothetical protein [Marseillevirus cajuinensis]
MQKYYEPLIDVERTNFSRVSATFTDQTLLLSLEFWLAAHLTNNNTEKVVAIFLFDVFQIPLSRHPKEFPFFIEACTSSKRKTEKLWDLCCAHAQVFRNDFQILEKGLAVFEGKDELFRLVAIKWVVSKVWIYRDGFSLARKSCDELHTCIFLSPLDGFIQRQF